MRLVWALLRGRGVDALPGVTAFSCTDFTATAAQRLARLTAMSSPTTRPSCSSAPNLFCFAEADAMKFPIKEALILLYLAGGGGAAPVGERLASLVWTPSLAAYVQNTFLRLGYAFVLSSSALLLDAFQRIVGEPLTYDALINLLNSTGFAGDALGQHGRPIASAAATSMLLLVGIALKPRQVPSLPRFAFVAAPLIGVAGLSTILLAHGGEGANGMPSAFPILAYSGIFLYEQGVYPTQAREDVTIPRGGPRRGDDILLIIDKSVFGSYLDINHAAGVTSGLACLRPGVGILNYEFAAPITDYSVGVNITLRHSGTRGDQQPALVDSACNIAAAQRAWSREIGRRDSQSPTSMIKGLLSNA